jgi:signal transduction histidine kinase
MHNVVKHAKARRVDLLLETSPTKIRLEVRDDGVGFDPSGSFPGHLGLQSMRDRMIRLEGSVDIRSAPGQGTLVRAWLPL